MGNGKKTKQETQQHTLARLEKIRDQRDALLEALQGLLPWLEDAETKTLSGDEGCQWVVESVRSAIAKATGEEACRNALTECTPMSQRRASRIMDARSAKATGVQG